MPDDKTPAPCGPPHVAKLRSFTATTVRVECSCGKKGSTAKTAEEALRLWADMNPQPGPTYQSDHQAIRAARIEGVEAGLREHRLMDADYCLERATAIVDKLWPAK